MAALRVLFMLVLGLFGGTVALAEDAEAEPAADVPEAASTVTEHKVRIAGQQVSYTATAGWLIVNNADGDPAARFGYTAYVRKGTDNPAERPVTFAFNGGPGSASIWLHMGGLGPKRVVVADADFTRPPPYSVVDNEHSILDRTDLVFIDPVGTGYSKPVGEAKGEDFWGVDQDIDSVSRFIEAWVRANNRWQSPKYVLGESYGGMRAGGVALELLDRHGMALNGVVLVSPFMAWASGFDGRGIDLPHVLFLPTLAATAWYHKALAERPDDLVAFIDEVKAFAFDQYAPALLKGSRLAADERARVLAGLARYTGVSETWWDRANLRVEHTQFVKELLRDRRQTAGRIDSRFVGRSFNRIGDQMEYDPFMSAVGPAFTAAFLDYYHRDLGFGQDLQYKPSGGVWGKWDWTHAAPGTGFKAPVPDTALDLARAMGQSPHMKLLVQQGYYDLATPQAASEYDIEHMDLEPAERANVRFAYYEAGHMMYLHPASLVKFREDLVAFYDWR